MGDDLCRIKTFRRIAYLMWQQTWIADFVNNQTYPLRCRIGSTVGSDPNSSIIPRLSGSTVPTLCVCTRNPATQVDVKLWRTLSTALYKNRRLESRYACAVYFHMLASVYMYTYIYIWTEDWFSSARGRRRDGATFHERRLFSLSLSLFWDCNGCIPATEMTSSFQLEM